MLKLIGAALFILCGGVLGFSKLAENRRSLELMRAMDNALGLMAGELELCARPLPELFELLAIRGDARVRGFFACLSLTCSAMGATEAWRRCCSTPEIPERVREILLSLAAVLGSYDAEHQCAEIELVRRQLKAEESRMQTFLSTQGRSWPALGACIAGAAAMLLI